MIMLGVMLVLVLVLMPVLVLVLMLMPVLVPVVVQVLLVMMPELKPVPVWVLMLMLMPVLMLVPELKPELVPVPVPVLVQVLVLALLVSLVWVWVRVPMRVLVLIDMLKLMLLPEKIKIMMQVLLVPMLVPMVVRAQVQVLMLILIFVLFLKTIKIPPTNQLPRNYPIYEVAMVGDVGAAGAVYPMDFQTNLGGIRFRCRDIGLSLCGDYLSESFHGAIIMCDNNSPKSCKRVPRLIRKIRSVWPDIPIVLCENKVDLQNGQPSNFSDKQFVGLLSWNIMYCQISQPSNYNIVMPFLFLAWMLDSYFISMPPLAPPELMLASETYRINYEAFGIRALMSLLNRRHNRDPNSPLPDYDVELMNIMEIFD